MKAPTVCSTPGCAEIVAVGKCEACRARDRRRYRRRPNKGEYGARWKRRRAEYLRSHKTCECSECACLPIEARPAATDVHHVKGVVTGERESDADLQALAHGHHSRITAKGQAAGGWNAIASRNRIRADRLPVANNPSRASRRTGQ